MHTVLILTGSPRTGGNSDFMAQALIRGVEAAGNRAVRYDAARHRHTPCAACDQCFRNGRPCASDGAFCALAPLLESAEALALVTPIYWLSFPAGLKMVLDKLYAFRVGQRSLSGKRSALLACGEGDRPGLFRPVELIYEDMAAYEGWDNQGIITVPGMREKGQIQQTDALDRAETLGRRL